MDLDFLFKIVAPVVTLLSLSLNIFQYRDRTKLSRLEAQRQLDRLEIEGERMRARQQQEVRDLEASYEGEVRERNNVRVDFRTVEDRRRDMVLAEEHGRQWNELFSEMGYFQRILGNEPGFMLGRESFSQKLKRKAHSVWRAIKS